MSLKEIQYPNEKPMMYRLLKTQLLGLSDGVAHNIANLSNASALLNQALKDINWAGFYLLEKERLVLGPFQGKPACVEIPVGSGVCGTAATKDAIVRVENVHAFPGHIACDSASNSEIVLPIHVNGSLFGVLDIDSPLLSRFDAEDEEGLSLFVSTLETILI